MLKIVQHLIKSRPNSLSLGKSWEVALVSLVPQGFKIPLQSKDTALFQRDWDLFISLSLIQFSKVERHCPVPKGLRHYLQHCSNNAYKVERHCPVPKGLRHCSLFYPWPNCRRKTLPCSKGIETYKLLISINWLAVERHCPVPKGLRPTIAFVITQC